jgi:hypothetical protein
MITDAVEKESSDAAELSVNGLGTDAWMIGDQLKPTG